jgi:hypothetical protein
VETVTVDDVGKADKLPLVIKGHEVRLPELAFQNHPVPGLPLILREGPVIELLNVLIVA